MAPYPQIRPLVRRLGAALPLALLGGLGLGSPALAVDAASGTGAKGAQVYCYMRSTGNSHDVSWAAAYALIKRQSASLFKTSPEHAAVMITEAVVQNPGSFPDCGKYLGDLYANAAQQQQEPAPTSGTGGSPDGSSTTAPASGGSTRSERYAY